MLEYLLIRPDDSPLFDGGRGARRQFIVLDEAHQYRGARGMEMGMLIRRLKQRLRAGGRQDSFRCIATSATISSGESEEDKQVVAEFAEERFGEPFSAPGIVFGESQQTAADGPPRRYHAFLRALEGVDPSRKSGGALHGLHCFCLEFDGACEVQRRVPTDWIIEPIDVSGYGSFSLAS